MQEPPYEIHIRNIRFEILQRTGTFHEWNICLCDDRLPYYEKSTKEDTDEFLQKEIQSMTEQAADDFYNACLHTYMNKYYSTILKIQDYQHEQEQKEYRIPSEPPKDLETKLKKEQQEIKAEIYQKLMNAVKAVNTSVQSESILKQYLERELKKQQNYIEDEIHRFEISGALDALDAENIQYYKWFANLIMDLCQYFGQKKLKYYADFFSSSSSLCCGVI